MQKKYSDRGFSLIEIMTAIGIMGMVIVTVCGVFVYGLYAIKKGRYRACAIHIANQKLVELQEVDWGNPLGIPTEELCGPPAGFIEGYSSSGSNIPYILWTFDGASEETYKIDGKQDMGGIDYNFTIVIESYQKNLKKVTITVRWYEVEEERKVELCTLLSRKI